MIPKAGMEVMMSSMKRKEALRSSEPGVIRRRHGQTEKKWLVQTGHFIN